MKSNTLILGDIGVGKTWCLRTLLPEWPDDKGMVRKGVGLSVRELALDPGWEATNGDLTCQMGFHVRQHLPMRVPWEDAEAWAEKIGRMSMKAVADMEVDVGTRQKYQQFVGLYTHAKHYVCERCGEDFGDIDTWGEDTAFVIDGLSGMSIMAQHLVNGPKPIMSLPQYGSAQELILNYLRECVSENCTFVLLAHWAREPNEISGGSGITVDTIGQKLAPKILRIFDEIIVAEREGTRYRWKTDDQRIALKARRLSYSENIEPSFVKIFGGQQ